MLSSLTLALLFTGAPSDAVDKSSCLLRIEGGASPVAKGPAQRYRPRPGDILFFDHHNKLIMLAYRFCGTASPAHVGVVFQRRDGSLAALEAGTNGMQSVFIFDLDERLRQYEGTIMVRQLKTPLTPEQSRELTDFCHEQEGKRYALGRLILQGTPFRPQGPLRTQLFGKTVLDRDRWMCSELVVASMAVAGVLDPNAYPANAMYPRDLCFDERYDLSAFYEHPALWQSEMK